MSNRFTQYILIAMALGIVMGTLVFNYLPDSRVEIAADVNLIAMLFLRLIKMIIAPLVFSTLVVGIAHMEDAATNAGVDRRRACVIASERCEGVLPRAGRSRGCCAEHGCAGTGFLREGGRADSKAYALQREQRARRHRSPRGCLASGAH